MALENMAASFAGLPMGDLIGGPLNASCEAQVRLAMATADFIKVVGFNVPSDAADPYSGGTRTAVFKFNRPVQITPAIPAVLDDQGNETTPAKPPVIKSEEVELEVPVLAIVKVPALSITQVDIT
jgi:hypothetical protein